MKIFGSLFFALFATALGAAPTNAPQPGVSEQEIGLHAGHGYFDGNARVVVYFDHVVVTNAQGRLSCERLTINLPPSNVADGHPTNAVAETNVDLVFINNKGETNHLTCDRGIYRYFILNGVTNETLTFSGHATNTSAKGWFTGEPLTWDNIHNSFDFGSNVQMGAHSSGSVSNGSPFNLLK